MRADCLHRQPRRECERACRKRCLVGSQNRSAACDNPGLDVHRYSRECQVDAVDQPEIPLPGSPGRA
jgi:hypothetical protein